jgi:hypothetical protein
MAARALAWSGCRVLVLGGVFALASMDTAWGQSRDELFPRPPLQVADRSPSVLSINRPTLSPTQSNEHPLLPIVRWANDGLRALDKVQDYSTIIVKRERIDGKLAEPQTILLKVRHKPFSVYMNFLKPDSLKGREVIYVQGANDGKMLAHGTRFEKIAGTLPLDPTGPIAMRGQRYPITEIGIYNLVRRLVEVGEKDSQYGECEVKFFPGAKINKRECTCIEVVHPKARRNFLFHVAKIFVDDEWNIPIRYESYDWPAKAGGKPELIEEYTYLNVKFNNGFADGDFDIRNPNYGFPLRK